jgi:glutathione S-transferase
MAGSEQYAIVAQGMSLSGSPLLLVGAPGSPYSRKMRSLMRYRRLPFRWIVRGSSSDKGIPEVPVGLIPVLVLPGEDGAAPTAMIDSTFQLRRLETLSAERSVLPPDPALAFIDALLEDYGDEWLTKAMFHYRWAYDADIRKASRVLPLWQRVDVADERIAPFSKMVGERQIGRLGVVGSNETTAPVIEASYQRVLALLDAHLQRQPFLFGRRPAASDFAIFGQLTQLVLFDPTPAALAAEQAPRVYAWLEIVEDMSGVLAEEVDWTTRDAFPESLRALLGEIGRVYAPFLLGNAEALASGAERVECEVDGLPWVQKPFPYQGKCLAWLRQQHSALAAGDRAAVDGWLEGTGCERLFASAG